MSNYVKRFAHKRYQIFIKQKRKAIKSFHIEIFDSLVSQQ